MIGEASEDTVRPDRLWTDDAGRLIVRYRFGVRSLPAHVVKNVYNLFETIVYLNMS